MDGVLSICWTRIPAVPVACLELITCGCKTKCKTAACKCVKSNQKCIPACGCDADGCRNPNMIGDNEVHICWNSIIIAYFYCLLSLWESSLRHYSVMESFEKHIYVTECVYHKSEHLWGLVVYRITWYKYGTYLYIW